MRDAPSEAARTSTLTIPPSTKLVLKQQETALKGIESFELPRSNIIKCAKSDIPDSVQLRKEVQQALVKSATVFISYLTATAHDNATKKKGKIITAQHVFDGVEEEPDQSVRLDDDAADASMLRKSLHAQDDADEDQLMDED
ncbi:hypothetical protein [Sporisorium scitamineum]|uniref:DNA polymerase epsilon subunit D n=1 Tax=Sporisorium scitamineum TaxID=49012 RepID=A0A0F7S7F2_9BASI|nr:hypothetical protein [Sporisorium scitamineum]